MTKDQRIGQVNRDNVIIYYAYIDGAYVESPNVHAVARMLRLHDEFTLIDAWQKRPSFRCLDTDFII